MARTVRIRLSKRDQATGEEMVLLVLEKGEFKHIDGGKSFEKRPGWGLPGGRAHDGEDPYLAAVRELEEETGLKANIDYMSMQSFPHGTDHTVIFFKATDPHGEIVPKDQQIVKAQWMPMSELDWLDEAKNYSPRHNHEGQAYPVYKTHMKLIHFGVEVKAPEPIPAAPPPETEEAPESPNEESLPT